MIDYGLFQFAGIPRCGTTWMLKACHAAGLGEATDKGKIHQPFPQDRGATLRVTLVRRPDDWLASYWKAIYPGATGVTAIDEIRSRVTQGHGWPGFVRGYLRACPGQFGRVVAAYGADTVMRLEDMPWALIELLESLGVPGRMLGRVREVGPQNMSKSPPTWLGNERLRRQLIEAEADVVESFEYY